MNILSCSECNFTCLFSDPFHKNVNLLLLESPSILDSFLILRQKFSELSIFLFNVKSTLMCHFLACYKKCQNLSFQTNLKFIFYIVKTLVSFRPGKCLKLMVMVHFRANCGWPVPLFCGRFFCSLFIIDKAFNCLFP